MRQVQSREVADELDNRNIGHKREQWEIRPERGANEAQRLDVRQGRMRSTVAHEIEEVPNKSIPELHGTLRNVAEVPNEPYSTHRNAVEVSGNPVERTRWNTVEVPSNPVYELYSTRT
jgi:hypothetical protein